MQWMVEILCIEAFSFGDKKRRKICIISKTRSNKHIIKKDEKSELYKHTRVSNEIQCLSLKKLP